MQVLSERSAAYTTETMKLLAEIANIGHYILEKLKRAQRGKPGDSNRLLSLMSFCDT